MTSPNLLQNSKAVVFDVFGTMAWIRDKRRPYVKLLELLVRAGRKPQQDDGSRLMSENVGLAGAAHLLGVDIPASALAALEIELYAELCTIELYPETVSTLTSLRNAGIKIGLCSNLAAPYAVPIKFLLPFTLDAYAWSFESGAVKPDQLIYKKVCQSLGTDPEQVVMVGDTFEADYNGPRNYGMQAAFLDRRGLNTHVVEHQLKTLDDILPLFGLPRNGDGR